jgi:hypothetical protein
VTKSFAARRRLPTTKGSVRSAHVIVALPATHRCCTLWAVGNGLSVARSAASAALVDQVGIRPLAPTCSICPSRSKKHLERLADVQEAMLAEEQEVQADASPATDAAVPADADSGSGASAASDDGEPDGAPIADEPPAARLSKKQQKKKQKQRERKLQAAMAGTPSAALGSDAELAAQAPRQRDSDGKLGSVVLCLLPVWNSRVCVVRSMMMQHVMQHSCSHSRCCALVQVMPRAPARQRAWTRRTCWQPWCRTQRCGRISQPLQLQT